MLLLRLKKKSPIIVIRWIFVCCNSNRIASYCAFLPTNLYVDGLLCSSVKRPKRTSGRTNPGRADVLLNRFSNYRLSPGLSTVSTAGQDAGSKWHVFAQLTWTWLWTGDSVLFLPSSYLGFGWWSHITEVYLWMGCRAGLCGYCELKEKRNRGKKALW